MNTVSMPHAVVTSLGIHVSCAVLLMIFAAPKKPLYVSIPIEFIQPVMSSPAAPFSAPKKPVQQAVQQEKSEAMPVAQKEPENYRDLIVRVAGYSDYFVNLGLDLQEEIIHRTEHSNI